MHKAHVRITLNEQMKRKWLILKKEIIQIKIDLLAITQNSPKQAQHPLDYRKIDNINLYTEA